MSYLGAGADWRKRNYLLEPDEAVAVCANTGAVNLISDEEFDARWPGGVITGEEYAIGTVNMTFTPAQYGAVGAFQPYVNTCGFFVGQTQIVLVVDGLPTPPLALDYDNSLGAFISTDTARPVGEQRCISGTPFLNGPFAMFFTEADGVTPKPVVGVSFNVGFLNAAGTIRVRAYDADCNLLGTWVNDVIGGFQNFNLNRDSDTPIIAGVVIDNLGDLAGYTTSRIRFSNECA